MRRIALLLLASAAFADSSPPTAAAGQARWLAGDLPLARVDGRRVRSAEDGDCAWVRPGSRWHALDAYGGALGDAAVKQIDEPGCYANFGRGVGEHAALYLSADSRPPAPTARWAPIDGERTGALYFFGGDGKRFAAIGGRSFTISRNAGGRSTVVHREPRGRGVDYEPIAAVDLDGDGEPEVIYRRVDTDVWQILVLQRTSGGWREIAAGQGGDFA